MKFNPSQSWDAPSQRLLHLLSVDWRYMSALPVRGSPCSCLNYPPRFTGSHIACLQTVDNTATI